jgi:hypothetical protein
MKALTACILNGMRKRERESLVKPFLEKFRKGSLDKELDSLPKATVLDVLNVCYEVTFPDAN